MTDKTQTTKGTKITIERHEKEGLWGLKIEWKNGNISHTGGIPLYELLTFIKHHVRENGDDVR